MVRYLPMDTTVTSQKQFPPPADIRHDIPTPPAAPPPHRPRDYCQIFETLPVGSSCAISATTSMRAADKKLVLAAAADAGCVIQIGEWEGTLRAWVIKESASYRHHLNCLLVGLQAIAVDHAAFDDLHVGYCRNKAGKVVDGNWVGTASDLLSQTHGLNPSVYESARDALLFWMSARRLGRGLSELVRLGEPTISIVKLDPKHGNVYQLDLEALRASQNRPDPAPTVATPEVAETSAQG